MTTKEEILDIAMNLNRVGNWAADDYSGKRGRIKTFLTNTSYYIKDLKGRKLPASFEKTAKDFIKDYANLRHEGIFGPKDKLLWAEKMITWGNILTHRSNLLEK